VAFGDDLFADRRVEPTLQRVQQQRVGIAGAEPGDRQARESDEHLGARRAHQGDPFCEQATAHEQHDLGGGGVEPLGVVDDHRRGARSATSASKVRAASPTRKRSGARPDR
jgi:hypothetical protein